MPKTMPRERSFCRYCGALTTYPDSCCAAHRDLLEQDTSEPVELEAVPAARERGH